MNRHLFEDDEVYRYFRESLKRLCLNPPNQWEPAGPVAIRSRGPGRVALRHGLRSRSQAPKEWGIAAWWLNH